MDISKTAAWVAILLGLASLTGTTLAPTHDTTIDEESKHLALRQVAHQLYVASGDSVSTIAPTRRHENTYSVILSTPVDYNKMPSIIRQATSDYDIDDRYQVSVRDCSTQQLLLGYNDNAQRLSDIPCQSRDHENICFILGVTYRPSQSSQGILLISGIVMLLGGTVSLYRQRGNPESTAEDSVENVSVSNTITDDTITTSLSTTPSIDINRHLLILSDRSVELTYREARLMQHLLEHRDTILNREDILASVWGEDGLVVGRSLDVFISRLRKIIKAENLTNLLQIKTVHGIGYQLLVEN